MLLSRLVNNNLMILTATFVAGSALEVGAASVGEFAVPSAATKDDAVGNVGETRLKGSLGKRLDVLIERHVAAREEDFKKHGGVRERMRAARTGVRGEDWDKSVYSRLDAAETADELAARAAEIKRAVDQAVWSLRRRKGWGRWDSWDEWDRWDGWSRWD